MDNSTTKEPQNHLTSAQFRLLIDLVDQHQSVLKLKSNTQLHKKKLDKIWQYIADRLNRINGPKRSSDHWRKVWKQIKYRVNQKSRKIHEDTKDTRVDPTTIPEMTPDEAKIMAIIGEPSVEDNEPQPVFVDASTSQLNPPSEKFMERKLNKIMTTLIDINKNTKANTEALENLTRTIELSNDRIATAIEALVANQLHFNVEPE